MSRIVLLCLILSACSTKKMYQVWKCDDISNFKVECGKIVDVGSCQNNLIRSDYCAVKLDNNDIVYVGSPVVNGIEFCSVNGGKWIRASMADLINKHEERKSKCEKLKKCLAKGIAEMLDCDKLVD